MDNAYSEFRHADLVKLGKLVTSMRLYYEEMCWATILKLVRSWSYYVDEFKAGRNQST